MFPGTQGYAEQAAELVQRYESIPFEHKYRDELALLPQAPSLILDIGAGSGADARWLCDRGHRVVAVEPVRPLREAGQALHAGSGIEWVDDGLPRLNLVVSQGRRFGVVLITAVWMHLDLHERRQAMPVVARLLSPGGVLLMALRHGRVPDGRRMFEVGAQETRDLAAAEGLRCLREQRVPSSQPGNRAAGIEWTRLAFVGPMSPHGA